MKPREPLQGVYERLSSPGNEMACSAKIELIIPESILQGKKIINFAAMNSDGLKRYHVRIGLREDKTFAIITSSKPICDEHEYTYTEKNELSGEKRIVFKLCDNCIHVDFPVKEGFFTALRTYCITNRIKFQYKSNAILYGINTTLDILNPLLLKFKICHEPSFTIEGDIATNDESRKEVKIISTGVAKDDYRLPLRNGESLAKAPKVPEPPLAYHPDLVIIESANRSRYAKRQIEYATGRKNSIGGGGDIIAGPFPLTLDSPPYPVSAAV